MNLQGNFWTVFRHCARVNVSEPPSEPLLVSIDDPVHGAVIVRARLSVPATHDDRLLVLVHGLGGAADSGYVREGAWAALGAGLACLRVSMRGADDSGEDIYHAGMGEDLNRVLAHPRLNAFQRVYTLGYSLGGHVALSHAVRRPDRRLKAALAVCSPVFLDVGQQAFDGQTPRVYRRHVLDSLKRMYFEVARNGRGLLPYHRIHRISTILDWDEQVVAPRHGFTSAEEYYRSVSVGSRLHDLKVPSLLVVGKDDPMVSAAASGARPGAPLLTLHQAAGGHLGFAPGTDVVPQNNSQGAARASVSAQLIAWLLDHP